MRHDDYVTSLINDDAFQERVLMAARAAQDFDAAIAAAMERVGLDTEGLSKITRINEERIQDLLDGDSAFVEEMLLLCHALHMDVHLDRDMHLHVSHAAEPNSQNHAVHYDYDLNQSEKSASR